MGQLQVLYQAGAGGLVPSLPTQQPPLAALPGIFLPIFQLIFRLSVKPISFNPYPPKVIKNSRICSKIYLGYAIMLNNNILKIYKNSCTRK